MVSQIHIRPTVAGKTRPMK